MPYPCRQIGNTLESVSERYAAEYEWTVIDSSVRLRLGTTGSSLEPEWTELELVQACQKGDRDAFRALFELHKDWVYSIALRYSGDRAAAMDIAQDTFLRLFSCIGGFRGDSKLETFLYRLVVNCCFDRKRKDRRLLPLVDEWADTLLAPDASPSEELLRSERAGIVRAAVEKLTPDLRMVIVLRYTEGLAYDEIAVAVGCSVGTVASRLNRAHRILRETLVGLFVPCRSRFLLSSNRRLQVV